MNGQQQVQYQSVTNTKLQQVSIRFGLWLGTRRSTRRSSPKSFRFSSRKFRGVEKLLRCEAFAATNSTTAEIHPSASALNCAQSKAFRRLDRRQTLWGGTRCAGEPEHREQGPARLTTAPEGRIFQFGERRATLGESRQETDPTMYSNGEILPSPRFAPACHCLRPRDKARDCHRFHQQSRCTGHHWTRLVPRWHHPAISSSDSSGNRKPTGFWKKMTMRRRTKPGDNVRGGTSVESTVPLTRALS